MKNWIEAYSVLNQEATRKGGFLFIDAETQSELDIKKSGSPRYTKHATPVCWAWAIDDGPIHLWTPGHSLDWLLKHEGMFVAHNVEFERWLLLHQYNLDIPPERWIDSAAVARFNNLPGSLEELGAYFKYPKDMEGSRIMKKLCKPRRVSKANPDRFWTPETKPDDFEKLYKYCKRDVEVSRHAIMHMRAPEPQEKQVMDLTVRMNTRGLPIDLDSLDKAQRLALKASDQLSLKMQQLIGVSASQTQKITDWCGMPSIAKANIRDALKDENLDPLIRQVLQIRQEYAKASTKKIDAFLNRHIDGKIHDGLIYGGAERTLRWSGGGIQPQNMPRGAGEKTDELFTALHANEINENIPDTIKSMVRGFIQAPLLVGDFSQIEARILAALAGDKDMLHAFASGQDPYKMMAAKIYHTTVDKITDSQRFMGKQTVLGCGYGLGKYGFTHMLDEVYDVQISEHEADNIVKAYRRSSPAVVKLWKAVEKGVRNAFRNPGKLLKDIHGLQYKAGRSSFFIQLPSGRRSYYRNVKFKGNEITCFGRLKNNAGYGNVKIYGGALVGHIVQGTARDLMANTLLRLDAAGFKTILTVHDEAVCLDQPKQLDQFKEVFLDLPDWAKDWPVDADCFATSRYRK